MTYPRRPPGSPLHHEPEAVTYAREKAGLTKAAAARRAGISPQLLGWIEKGVRNATPPVLMRLADALNCPIVVLERKRTPSATTSERGAV